jgi:hypothetical protein
MFEQNPEHEPRNVVSSGFLFKAIHVIYNIRQRFEEIRILGQALNSGTSMISKSQGWMETSVRLPDTNPGGTDFARRAFAFSIFLSWPAFSKKAT